MKFFVFVLLFGLAVAVPYHGLYRDEGDEDGNEEKSEIERKLEERRDIRSKLIELLRRLKNKLEEVQDKGKIRTYIENNIKSSELREMLLKVLDQGVEKLKKFLEKFDPPEKRSLGDYFDKLIDILGEVRLTTKEKLDSFIEFLKETYDGGRVVLKDKASFVRHLAQQFLDRAEKASKKVAEQALEFFRPYREDLGKLYDDLEAKVKEIVSQ